MTGGIVVLGGEGMLGHKMFQRLRERFQGVSCTLRGRLDDAPLAARSLFSSGDVIEGVDVLMAGRVDEVLTATRPRVVVNCVGVIKQRPAASDAITSIAVNALLSHQLAARLAEWGGRLVHFSTDCVFSGRRGGYREEDPSDAEDLYGRTKYLGEVTTENAATLRTSIIGRELSEHRSLLDWFLQQEGRTVRGFTRVIYSGVTTNHLAHVVGDVLEYHAGLHGLFQVVSDPISKHDLLVLLRDAYGLSVSIEPDDGEVSDRSMKGDKFRAATGYRCPPWPDLVRELAADVTPYKRWWTADEAI